MIGVDLSGLQELDQRLAKTLEQLPQMRREYHERMGVLTKSEVDSSIGRSGLRDTHGNVRRWQVISVGSGGGYAAVRPAGSKEGAQTGKDGPGAITNYLETGHRHRQSKDPNYRTRIRVMRTPAFLFYASARSSVEPLAIREAEQLVDQVATMLEG